MDARSAFQVGSAEPRGPGVKIVPPPEGLARGRTEAPRWAIGVLLLVVLVLAGAWIIHRARQAKARLE